MRALSLCLVLIAGLASAQDLAQPPALEPVPDGAPASAQDETLPAPEVTIRRLDRGTIEEYRSNGQLYMVKVIPTRGTPYYLIDNDGDGSLETRRNDLDDNVVVPAWVILSW